MQSMNLTKNNINNKKENKNLSFYAFFVLYFKKMCSWKQLLFYFFVFMIIFIAISTINFYEMYSVISVISIILFFTFNYGLFIYNLKKSNIYSRIREEKKYQLKNYSSIILNVIILTLFIYIILIIGAVVDNQIHDFKYESGGFLVYSFEFSEINFFWLYYSVLLISIIIMLVCFFVENITKTVKNFFITMFVIVLIYLIMDLVLIKIQFCKPNILTYPVENDPTSLIHIREIENFIYYDINSDTLNVSMSLNASNYDVPYLFVAIFYPFFALQSILITSFNNTTLLPGNTYDIGNVVLNTDTTTINELFIPHLFHWDSTSYIRTLEEPNVKMSYAAYNIYFILTYFYILLFLVLALISRKINKKKIN
ncbi:MAG: hypothetical protein HPAVJP_0640 [Candidatus Hepatoplasma vulgare]|nr:MAG: hypothetical protein HPAVJP_0640 [Candidatus Hepatoplasma sp.]